jgi:hypothetical protein
MRVIAARLAGVFSVMAMLVPLSARAGLENTTNMARGHHACTAIMGLDRLDWPYRSLKDSLQQLNQTRLVSTDRSKCQKQSLEPRDAGFRRLRIGRHKAHCSER